MADDYKQLGLGQMTSLVTNMKVSLWGSEVLLECVYDPTGSRLPYKLNFQDCQEIKWNVHSPEDVRDLEADLIGISLGEGGHQQAAVIHTDIFEISILYGSFSVSKLRDAYGKQILPR